jgi:formamidopyrimidine-DNA glycosylase
LKQNCEKEVTVPELPEVETVRRGLQPTMEGARLARLELRRPDLRFPFTPGMAERLEGRRIESLTRRAKYLLINFEDGLTAISHLGMSGSYRVEAAEGSETPGVFHLARSKDEKHDHVIFHLAGKEGPARVVYNDPRRFGFLLLEETARLSENTYLAGLGPEPTGNSLSAEMLAAAFAGKKAPLKAALLDQTLIAGLGNIYVCEALFRAGLSPARAAGTLVDARGRPKPKLADLASAVRDVIAEAIAAGGSSLRDHIQTDGSLGYFQHTFRVYDREGKACSNATCGQPVQRMVQSGRSTFFCARCQK